MLFTRSDLTASQVMKELLLAGFFLAVYRSAFGEWDAVRCPRMIPV